MKREGFKRLSKGRIKITSGYLEIGDLVLEDEDGIELDVAVLFSYFREPDNLDVYKEWEDAEYEYRSLQKLMMGITYRVKREPNKHERSLIRSINKADFTGDADLYIFEPYEVIDAIDVEWVKTQVDKNVIIDVRYDEGLIIVKKDVRKGM